MKHEEIFRVLSESARASDPDYDKNKGRWRQPGLATHFNYGSMTAIPGFKITEVDRYGGEGKGEEYWFVLRVTNQQTGETGHARFCGYYQSEEGVEFSDPNGFTVVQAVPVQAIEWKAIKE